jgi:ABC-type multidrug transport system fused ATPase/permease subunit
MKKLWNNLDVNRKYFVITLLVGVVYSSIGVIVPTVSGKLINTVISDLSGSKGLFVFYLSLSLLQIVLSLLDEYMGNTLQIRQRKQMRKQAFETFSRKENSGREDIASFVSFVNNDIPSISEQYFLGTVDIIKCISIILFSAVSLLYIHWIMALVIISISVLIVIVPKIIRKQGGEARKKLSQELARYNTSLQSFLGGLRILKAYRYHKRANDILDKINQSVVKRESRLLKKQLIVRSATSFLQVSKTVATLIAGILLVSQKIIDVGDLVAALQLAAIISSPIEVLAYLLHSRNEVMPLLERFEKMIASNKPQYFQKNECDKALETISLNNVSYQAGDFQILNDVSVTFEAGQKYLIMGESGSGKSTLLRLIAQIGDLNYTGQINLNQTEIRTLDCKSYYGKVCLVFQEPYLFHATLEENILLGRGISSETYHNIIEKLNLAYLLERYKGQELTPEVIEQLSGGERFPKVQNEAHVQ